jgi:hypothetical protein
MNLQVVGKNTEPDESLADYARMLFHEVASR